MLPVTYLLRAWWHIRPQHYKHNREKDGKQNYSILVHNNLCISQREKISLTLSAEKMVYKYTQSLKFGDKEILSQKYPFRNIMYIVPINTLKSNYQ